MVDRTAFNLSLMKRLKRKKRAPARLDVERHHVDALENGDGDLSVVLDTNNALITRLGLDPAPNDRLRVDVANYPAVARPRVIGLNGLLNAVAVAEARMGPPVPVFVAKAHEDMVEATYWEAEARAFVDAVTQWYS